MLIKNTTTSLTGAAVLAIGIVCLSAAHNIAASPCYCGWIALAAINDGNTDGAYSPEAVDELCRSGYEAMDDMHSQYV